MSNMGPGISVAELKNLTAIRQAQQSNASSGMVNQLSNQKQTSNNIQQSHYSSQRPSDLRVAPISGHSGVYNGLQSPPILPPHFVGNGDTKIPEVKTSTLPSLGRPQSSGRMVKGLTVEQLKELTKLRLKAQGFNQNQVQNVVSNTQTMRRTSSMPYHGCASASNNINNHGIQNPEVTIKSRYLSRLHSCENIRNEYLYQPSIDERLSMIHFNDDSSPKVLSQSASRCSTPVQNETQGSSSVSPASPINLSALDNIISFHSSFRLSPKKSSTTHVGNIPCLPVTKKKSFLYANGSKNPYNESNQLGSNEEEVVHRVYSKYDLFSDFVMTDPSQNFAVMNSVDDSVKEKDVYSKHNSPAGSLSNRSDDSSSKIFSKKPSHLRINSIDAFPCDNNILGIEAESCQYNDMFSVPAYNIQCETPSVRSAIAMEVAEFALSTPVAGESGKSPVLSTLSPQWTGYNSEKGNKKPLDYTVGGYPLRWRSATESKSDSAIEKSKVDERSIFSAETSKQGLSVKARSSLGFSNDQEMHQYSEKFSRSPIFGGDHLGVFSSLGYHFERKSPCSFYEPYERRNSYASLTSAPSYTSSAMVPTPKSILNAQGSSLLSSFTSDPMNSNLSGGLNVNHGTLGHSDGDSVQTILYSFNNWPNSYQL